MADDGRLYLKPDVSEPGNWQDLGIIPSGTPAVGIPAGVTYIDQGGRQIRVFFRSVDGHLNLAWPQGNIWLMQDQGTPPGTKVASNPAAVTYFFDQSIQRVYCFVVGEDGSLYLNKWDGSWSWVRVGAPGDVRFSSRASLSAINFFDGNEPQVYVFAEYDNSLYSTQETIGWPWTDHGAPGPLLNMGDDMAAVGYLDLLTKKTQLFAFVGGFDDRNLYVFDGSKGWENQGRPDEASGISIGAVHYIFETNSRFGTLFRDAIFAFTPSGPGDLQALYSVGGQNWLWGNRDTPGNPGVPVTGKPRAAAFYENSVERLFAAVRGTNGQLYMAWWNDGTQHWDWLRLGFPTLSTAVHSAKKQAHTAKHAALEKGMVPG